MRSGLLVAVDVEEELEDGRAGLGEQALGLVGAWWLGRAAASLLFGVTATDPLTFTTVSLLLTAVAVAATVARSEVARTAARRQGRARSISTRSAP